MNFKNIAKGSTESFKVDEGVILLKQTNENEFESNFNSKIGKDYIQFHFCLKGSSKFLFNQGSYVFNVENENSTASNKLPKSGTWQITLAAHITSV